MSGLRGQQTILYVGGLAAEVTEELVHAAFIPFGDIKSVQISKDYVKNKSKGFGFVEFDQESDCSDALENMDGSELCGKILSCSIAKEMKYSNHKGKAVWNADEYIVEHEVVNHEDDALAQESLLPQE